MEAEFEEKNLQVNAFNLQRILEAEFGHVGEWRAEFVTCRQTPIFVGGEV